jgi:hypothetical protein
MNNSSGGYPEMDQIEFTLNGKRHRLDRDMVEAALRGQVPGRISVYAVDVRGQLYPVKQALASALHIKKNEFISTRAVELLRRIGMEVIETDNAGSPVQTESQASPATIAVDPARIAALELAVAHLRPNTQAPGTSEVLRVATDFLDWLGLPR